jgi:hypothetical protein
METKLTDFTSKNLLFASMLFKEKLDDCNSKIELIMKFQDTLTKTELLFHWMGERDKASLWLTQIDTALIEVKQQEIINSN